MTDHDAAPVRRPLQGRTGFIREVGGARVQRHRLQERTGFVREVGGARVERRLAMNRR